MDVEKSLLTIHGFILAGHDIEPGDSKQRKNENEKVYAYQIKGFLAALAEAEMRKSRNKRRSLFTSNADLHDRVAAV